MCCVFAAHSSMKYGHIPHLIRYDGGDTVRRERKTEITRIEKVWNGIPIGKGSSCRFFVDNFFNTEQISKKVTLWQNKERKHVGIQFEPRNHDKNSQHMARIEEPLKSLYMCNKCLI